MQIWNDMSIWIDGDGVCHIFTTCVAIKGVSLTCKTATAEDKKNVCKACVERLKAIPDSDRHEGKPIA